MNRALFLVVLVLVALIAGVVRLRQPHLDNMLGTDEADYVRAMSYGLLPNYLATRERSGVAFASEVLHEYRQTGWARPFQRDWAAGDAAGLRHYHPPFPLYPLAVVLNTGTTEEQTLRAVPLVTGVLAAVAAAVLAFVLLDLLDVFGGVGRSVKLIMSATAGLLTALSPYHVIGSTEVGPHAAFSLFSTLALAALTLAVRRPDSRWWTLACAAMGLAVLTVPYWALLLPALLWVWWLGRGSDRSRVRSLGIGVAAAAIAALAAWPPLLFEVAFVKPVFMYAGIIVKPLVNVQTPGAWAIDFVRTHAPLSVMLLIGVGALPALSRDQRRAVTPTLLFVAAFFVLNLRVGHMKALYASDIVAPLAALASALAGFAFVAVLKRFAAAAAGVALAVVLVPGLTATAPIRSRSDWRDPIATLNDQLRGQQVLVTPRPAGAIMKYYAPGVRIVLDSNHPEDAGTLRHAIASRQIDVLLRWGSGVEPGGVVGRLIPERPPDGKVSVSGTIVSWWQLVPRSD